jgi:hypothetical protein
MMFGSCPVSNSTKIHKKDEAVCHMVLLAEGETFSGLPLLKDPSMLWVKL